MTHIKTGVIGHPISHSKSPLIHNFWIKQHGLDGQYKAIDIKPADLPVALPRLLKEDGYTGFNLTIPHKEIAMDICDEIDPIGMAISAVNTVHLRNDGTIFGTNTDAFGFIYNIKQQCPDFDFTSGKIVVLGAGGAAKAIIHGLLQEGTPRIVILNRTFETADKLAQISDKITALPWEDRHAALSDCTLVVNTTALGMHGQPPLDLNLAHLPPSALVSDIVYAPLMTPLLTHAKTRGNAIITGIGMLLHQARPSFELWYSVMPTVTPKLEDLVL